MSGVALLTPFHARLADHAPGNAWAIRGSFTVPAHYGAPLAEALAGRVSAVMADVSYIEDLRIHGSGAAAFLSAACGKQLSELVPGRSEDVYWCTDGGGVRGLGTVSRFGETNFLLRSHDADSGWFTPAAFRFGAALRDATAERGLLVIAGPFAWAILAAAGLEAAAYLKPGDHAIYQMGDAAVTVFRREALGAYLISTAPDDGPKIFDRLMRAGHYFGLRLAGEEALAILELEAGLIRPHLDFEPARAPFAAAPTPSSLALTEAGKISVDGANRHLVGLELDSGEPSPNAPVFYLGTEVGRTRRSLYSPALKCAIALASLSRDCAQPGTMVTFRHCRSGAANDVAAKVVALPFLK